MSWKINQVSLVHDQEVRFGCPIIVYCLDQTGDNNHEAQQEPTMTNIMSFISSYSTASVNAAKL